MNKPAEPILLPNGKYAFKWTRYEKTFRQSLVFMQRFKYRLLEDYERLSFTGNKNNVLQDYRIL